MLIVFMILALLTGIVWAFRFIPNADKIDTKYKKSKRRQKFVTFNNMDEDMRVAVLVATIVCKKENNTDVVLKSVRKL